MLLAWSRVPALPEISSLVTCVRQRAARRSTSMGRPRGAIKMKRRELICALGGAAFLSSTSSFAQQPKKTHRIGVLWHGANVEEEAIYLAALRKGLLDVGYVEGQNIVLDMRFPAEEYERFFVLAAELARQKLDVLVSAAGIAAIACHRATTTIPIVARRSILCATTAPGRPGLGKATAEPWVCQRAVGSRPACNLWT